MRISDWSSDVCSSDLVRPPDRLALVPGHVRMGDGPAHGAPAARGRPGRAGEQADAGDQSRAPAAQTGRSRNRRRPRDRPGHAAARTSRTVRRRPAPGPGRLRAADEPPAGGLTAGRTGDGATQGGTAKGDSRSEEHTSELQALMRNTYAVFC